HPWFLGGGIRRSGGTVHQRNPPLGQRRSRRYEPTAAGRLLVPAVHESIRRHHARARGPRPAPRGHPAPVPPPRGGGATTLALREGNMLPPIEQLLITSDRSLRDAIATIDKNAQGICF